MQMKSGLAVALIALGVAACGSSSHTVTHTKQSSAVTPAAAPTNTTQTVAARIAPLQPVLLYRPLAEYTNYVEQLLRALHPQLKAMRAAAAGGDLHTAEHDWLAAHVTWLEVGQDDAAYGAFGQLGQRIDGLPHGL